MPSYEVYELEEIEAVVAPLSLDLTGVTPSAARRVKRTGRNVLQRARRLKALVWFWLIDETLSANLVYQRDYEIGSTTPSDEEMAKIMTMVMAW